MTNAVLLLTVTCLLAGGQFLFKAAGLAIQHQTLPEVIWTLATLPSFYLALAIYGSATVLWIYVLSRVPLTQAYPWVAGATVLVPLLGHVFYGEVVSPIFWMGMALILAGLLLTQFGVPH
jgi:multidrug transporter EmrE-like cation transporter